MNRFTFFLLAVVTAGLVSLIGPAPSHADGESAPYITDIPQGYRDWK